MTKIVVVTEPLRVLSLEGEPLTVGRSARNDVVLGGSLVSRQHCRLEPEEGGGHRVVDLGSENGTFLNGERVRARSLDENDELLIGEHLLLVLADERDPELAIREHAFAWPTVVGPRAPQPTAPTARLPLAPGRWSELRRLVGRDGGAQAQCLLLLLQEVALLSQGIANEFDLYRLMERVLDELMELGELDQAVLVLADQRTGRLEAALRRAQDPAHLERPFPLRMVREALDSRRTLVWADLSRARGLGRLGAELAVCLPLYGAPRRSSLERRATPSPSRPLGAIYLASGERRPEPEPTELRLCEAVAAQAASALYAAQLRQQAITDPLTQLTNRVFLQEILLEELARARAGHTPLSLILVDLDHFKQVNDTHGHLVGDDVLQRVAQRTRRAVRQEDPVCRWGGEEFLVLLPGQGVAEARAVAQRIAEAVSGRAIGAQKIAVTCSMGIASFPDHGEDGEALLRCADRALYSAKDAGRNRIEVGGADAPALGRK